MTDAKRITEAVLEVLKRGGDNLAVYEAVREALAAAPAVGGEEMPTDPNYKWGMDYGKDLLKDINQLAHAAGTGALHRDMLQRAYREIRRLSAQPASPLRGITDEMVNAAAREMWNDRDARHGGGWDTRDPREVCVIQTKATAKAALTAALSAETILEQSERLDGTIMQTVRLADGSEIVREQSSASPPEQPAAAPVTDIIEQCAQIAEGPLMPGCNGRFRGREGANWEAKPMRHTYAAGRLEAAAEIRASSASLSEQHEETK